MSDWGEVAFLGVAPTTGTLVQGYGTENGVSVSQNRGGFWVLGVPLDLGRSLGGAMRMLRVPSQLQCGFLKKSGSSEHLRKMSSRCLINRDMMSCGKS